MDFIDPNIIGVAAYLLSVTSAYENWHTKFNQSVHQGKLLPEHEWLRFINMLEDWVENLALCLQCVGCVSSLLYTRFF